MYFCDTIAEKDNEQDDTRCYLLNNMINDQCIALLPGVFPEQAQYIPSFRAFGI